MLLNYILQACAGLEVRSLLDSHIPLFTYFKKNKIWVKSLDIDLSVYWNKQKYSVSSSVVSLISQ